MRLVFSQLRGDNRYALVGDVGPLPPRTLAKSTKLGADGLLLITPAPLLAVLRLGL